MRKLPNCSYKSKYLLKLHITWIWEINSVLLIKDLKVQEGKAIVPDQKEYKIIKTEKGRYVTIKWEVETSDTLVGTNENVTP